MPCYRPLTAWRSVHRGKTGKNLITFDRAKAVHPEPFKLPCGQCIGCRLERSRQWAMRCYHESLMHDDNCFITLTYNPESVPKTGSLFKADFQKFMKRYRKNTGAKLKYFMCGEYGEKNKRPHYHACIFGHDFQDRQFHKKNAAGDNLYTSDTLSTFWGLGNCLVGNLTFESAAYVARYVTKKITGDKADGHYQKFDFTSGEVFDIIPEYCASSNGIGKSYLEKYQEEVYPQDEVIVRGRKMRPPKYYDLVLEREKPDLIEALRAKRKLAASQPDPDKTDDRLFTREQVQIAKSSTFQQRSYEK